MVNLRTGYANPNEAFFQIRLRQDIASYDDAGGFCFWEQDTGKVTLAVRLNVDRVVVDSTGRFIVAALGSKVLLFMIDNGACRRLITVDGHVATVSGICMSPCEKYVATSSLDGSFIVWRLPELRKVTAIMGSPRTQLTSICFGGDSRTL